MLKQLINSQDIINVCEGKRTSFNLNYKDLQFPSQNEQIEVNEQVNFITKDGQKLKISKCFNFYTPQQLIFENSILQSIDKLPNQSLRIFSQSLPHKESHQRKTKDIFIRNDILDQEFIHLLGNKSAFSKQLFIRLSLQESNQKMSDIKLWLKQQSIPTKNPFKNIIRRDPITQIKNIGYLVPWIKVDNYYKERITQLLRDENTIKYIQNYKYIKQEIKILFYREKLLNLLSFMNYYCLQDQLQQDIDSFEKDDILINKYKKTIQQFNDIYFKNLIQILEGHGGQDYKYLCINGCEGKQLTSYKDNVTQSNYISQAYEEYEEYDE